MYFVKPTLKEMAFTLQSIFSKSRLLASDQKWDQLRNSKAFFYIYVYFHK